MKKILKYIFLCTLFMTSMNVVHANETYIIDDYDQFSVDEENYYNQLASDFENQFDIEVFIVNLETTKGDPTDAANEAYINDSDNVNVIVIAYSDDYYLIKPFGNAISLVKDDLWDIYYQETLSVEQRFDALFQELERILMNSSQDDSEEDELVIDSLLVDAADILTDEEESQLLSHLEKVSEKYQIDVTVATTNDMNGSNAESYARSYYQNAYQEDGIILMIDMEDRAWALVSNGEAKNVFVRDVRDTMSDEFVSYLSDGNYYDAFTLYANQVDQYYDSYQTYGSNYLEELDAIEYEENKWIYFGMGLGGGAIVGLILGLIIRWVLVNQCKMVKMKSQAKDYLVKNSMCMRKSHDYFLYSNVVRTARPKDDDRSSSSSSSSHDSGGSSGRF